MATCQICNATEAPMLLACQACQKYSCANCLVRATQPGCPLLICPYCASPLPLLAFHSMLQNVSCKDLIAAFANQLQSEVDAAHAFTCPLCATRVHMQPGTSAAFQCPACGEHSCLFCCHIQATERENHTHVCACPANPNAGQANIYSAEQHHALRHTHVKQAVLAFFRSKIQGGNARLIHSVKIRARAYLRTHYGFDLSKAIMREVTKKKK